MLLYPSLTAGNLLRLEKTLSQLRDLSDGFHVDMMDGHFVPNYGMSADLINAIGAYTPLPLWIHVMATNPELAIKLLVIRPGDIITVHYESGGPEVLSRVLQSIKDRGGQAGLALKPETPVRVVMPYVSLIRHVTIMAVEPGFSGQVFLPTITPKIAELVAWVHRAQQEQAITVGVDGGIHLGNLTDLVQQGVDMVALGSAIFVGGRPDEKLEHMRALLK